MCQIIITCYNLQNLLKIEVQFVLFVVFKNIQFQFIKFVYFYKLLIDVLAFTSL